MRNRHVLAAVWALSVLPCAALWGQAADAPARPATAPAGPASRPTPVPPEAPATAPASQPAARASLADAIARIAPDLEHNLPARRQAAQKALQALCEGVFDDILAQVRVKDPEQAARACELFAALAASARQVEMLIRLSPAQRTQLLEWVRRQPAKFNQLLSRDDQVVASAVTALGKLDHPGADLVLLWACGQSGWEVRFAAYDCLMGKGGASGSAALRDILAERMESMDPSLINPYYAHNEQGPDAIRKFIARNEYRQILQVLVAARDARALARLLRPYLGSNQIMYYGGQNEGMDMLLALNDKRTVVTLMDEIKNDQQVTSIGFGGGKTVQVKRGDVAMAIILTQTKQDLAAYGFYMPPNWRPALTQMGFVDDQKRTEARKKIADWFAKARKEYESVDRISAEAPAASPPPPKLDGQGNLPAALNRLGA